MRAWPLWLLCACPGGESDTADPVPSLDEVVLTVDEVVPTVLHATWTSSIPGASHVRYGLDGGLSQRSPSGPTGLTHSATLLGLKAGHTYSWQAVTRGGGGQTLESPIHSVEIAPPPPELAHVVVSASSAQPREGFVLTSQLGIGDSWAVIVDRDGDYVWFHEAEGETSISTAKPSLGGRAVVYTHHDRDQVVDRGHVVRVAVDGSEVVSTRTHLGHHDFVELNDGRVAWLSVDFRTVEVDGVDTPVAADTVLAAPPGSAELDDATELFNFFDDYPHPPWRTCVHFDAELWSSGARDWTHANSLVADPAGEALYLLSKNLDALLKIDLETGAVLWQMGGLYSDFSLSEGGWWSHGHLSQVWEDGLVVFDNGFHHDPPRSRLVEYAYDEEARTVVQVWEHTDPVVEFVPLLGDARKLPGGTYLASWTSAGTLTEVAPDGEVVWRLEASLGSAWGRVRWIEDLYDLRAGER